jgi:hypothetical protein
MTHLEILIMKQMLLFLTLFLIFFVNNALAAENSSKEEFLNLNQKFLSFFTKKAPKHIKVIIYDNWEINYPAASTDRSTDFQITMDHRPIKWSVSVLSGYYQEPLGGEDVHILTLCHEMAHHMALDPYKTDEEGNLRWASMEAQSDYWATKNCIPMFLDAHPEYLNIRKVIHPEIKRRCERKFFKFFKNYKYCIFSSQAALQIAKIHQKYRLPSEELEDIVNPETPDQSTAQSLDRNSYPGNQCRFDTCFAGALKNERPSCWYPKI